MRTWVVGVAWLSIGIAAPTDAVTARLSLGGRASAVLTPGRFHSYRLDALTGFRLELEQHDADFAIEAVDQHGTLLRTIDAFAWGTETATFPSGTNVRSIRIRRVDSERFVANYVVRLVDIPEWSAMDENRMHAEDASTEARSLIKTADSAREKAVSAARRAVELWHSVGDTSAHLRASIQLADSLNSATGSFDEVREIYTRSLTLGRELSDFRSEAECLNNRGIGLWRQSAFPEAISDLQKALQVWAKLPPMTGRGATLNNLGLLAWEIGEYDNALRFDSQALRFLRSIGNQGGEAFVLNNMALVEGALGQWTQSIQSFERAAFIFSSLADNLAAGRALSNSARMYLRVHNTSQAESNVRRGLALIERGGDDRAKTENLNLWGEVCAATHRANEALDHLRQALDLSRKTGDQRAEANALANIGLTLIATPDRAQGITSLQDSLRIYRKIGTPASQASVLYHLALAQRDSGDLESAYASAGSAVAIAETLRGNVAAENLRISFLASTHDYYSALIDIAMQKGETKEGWQIAERARARALLDSISRAPRSDREEQLIRQLNSESLKLMRGSQDSEDRRKRLENLHAELMSVEDRLRNADTSDAGLSAPTIELSDLQHQLGEDLAIVEYALGEPCGYAWVITRTSVNSFRLPPQKGIEAASQEVNLSLSDAKRNVGVVTPAFRRAAVALAQALILPALSDAKVKRLVFIPDGSIELLPFEALPIGSNAILLDRYEVSESPSAAVLVALTSRKEGRFPAAPKVALVGDPVFDTHDARLQSLTTKDEHPAELARLPFSHREITAIAALRSENTTILLDFDATKEALVSGRLNAYSVIHLSTHGVPDATDPKRSALVFSLVDRGGLRRDGLLSVDEVAALHLSANLVVLSACSTATGRQWRGEGMLSLTRAFLHTGARRVISTRWPVDDEASAALLVNFYREMWTAGVTPSAALRKAQLAVRSQLRWRSPFYWAAFVLQGAQ